MEFTNDNLKKMDSRRKKYNIKYGKYFYKLYLEYSNKNFINRSNKISSCLNYWEWDLYEKNKIMDLKKVNRCNSRFCPNCKQLDISKFIYKFRSVIEDFSKDYFFYFLTLTIPSVPDNELENTLIKLNKAFTKFKELYSYPKFTSSGRKSKRTLHDRLIDVAGGIRVLEITYNAKNGYHPHYHIFIMTETEIPENIIKKKHIARYSTSRQKIDLKSDLEKQISKVWAEIWYNIKIKDNDYKLSETFFDKDKGYKVLEVDLREFDEGGIYETIKYTFKDSEISNYYVFKTLYFALYGKRMRQGFGILYNLKIDDTDIEIGEQQELVLEFAETPTKLITKQIIELLTTYKEYKKISRYVPEIQDDIKNQ